MKNLKFLSLLFASILLITACGKDDEDGGGGIERPNISVSDMEITEGDDDNNISITVSLSGTNEGTAVVSYSTVDNSANSGSDYSSVEGSISFASGETEKTVEIEIKGDEFAESDERFEFLLLNPINANILNAKAVITILDDDTQTGNPLDIPTTGYVTPETYADYTLVWQDEFQGTSLDEACWNYEIGNGSSGWGNNELQYYKSENVSLVQNDYLVIEAKQQIQSGFNYTSSRLTTQNKKSYKYGRVDIRAVLPKGKGLWPALWMLGDNITTVGWPSCGEIDIMEMVGGPNKDNTVHGTIHWKDNGNNVNYGNSHVLSDGIFADEFHVFSIVWDESLIKWYMDDIQYGAADITPTELSEFQESFFFIFNVAVGGNWPGSPDASTVFPQRMIVDYIRVFQ